MTGMIHPSNQEYEHINPDVDMIERLTACWTAIDNIQDPALREQAIKWLITVSTPLVKVRHPDDWKKAS